MSRLVALYPAAWRARYEDEFRAVLAVRPPSLGERLDIVRGAIDARLRPQLPGPERIADRFGLGPLAGFALLALAVLLYANGPVQDDEYGTYRDGSAALPFFVLAAVLLSVGLYRVVKRLPFEANGPRAAGWTAIIAGPTWAFMPWVLPVGLVFLLAMLVLAAGARRAGLWPTWSVVALTALLALPAGLFSALPFLPWYTLRLSGLDLLFVLGPIAAVWLIVGALLVRGFPRATRS